MLQELAKYSLKAESSPLTVCVNKVLLEYTHILCLLLSVAALALQLQDYNRMACKTENIYTLALDRKKFASPWSR